MKFKEATDLLFSTVSHAELAEALGVSVASIRQARLAPNAKAFREPPKGWEPEVYALAKKRIAQYELLAAKLSQAEKPVLGIKTLK